MRKDYIAEQKRNHNRRALVVLPIHYPKEILTALNILAVELWGPPGAPRSADVGRIQTYICPIVRNALAFLAGGGAELLDGLFFPHTCDSIQGLATLVPDFGGWDKAIFRFIHPKGEPRAASRQFLERELAGLVDELEVFCGEPLKLDRLRWAITLHREIDGLRARLTARRACLKMNDLEFYTLLRRGEFLWPEDHLEELREAARSLGAEPVQGGVPIMISGIVPEPMSIFENLNEAGAYVAADDYAALGRRIVRSPAPPLNDPVKVLVELYFYAAPCPTRASDLGPRLDYLERLYGESGAAGLILHNIKFCEPEIFDLPVVRKRFSDLGAPVLYMESELETALSGQALTRLEAFVEMVDKAGVSGHGGRQE